jgi:hypothetical protein
MPGANAPGFVVLKLGRLVQNWVLQIDSASKSSLLTSAMSWHSRSCSYSVGTAPIRFLALH